MPVAFALETVQEFDRAKLEKLEPKDGCVGLYFRCEDGQRAVVTLSGEAWTDMILRIIKMGN